MKLCYVAMPRTATLTFPKEITGAKGVLDLNGECKNDGSYVEASSACLFSTILESNEDCWHRGRICVRCPTEVLAGRHEKLGILPFLH